MELIGVKNTHAFIFSENNIPKWKLELSRSFWGQKIVLVELEKKKIKTVITKQIRFIINCQTLISFKERLNEKLVIPTKFFTCQIDFQFENNFYEFIEHSGLNYSIFKNGNQIGFYKKQHINFLNMEGIIIKLNDDSDIELILSVISISDLNFYNSGSAITLNAGNLIVSKRKFNLNWKPK